MSIPKDIITGQKIDPAKLERAKELRREMTEEERILWRRLRADKLKGFHFRRQQIIDGFIVDFYCHAAGLVVEVDGPIHDRQTEYDERRDRALCQHGLRILRVRNEEVRGGLAGVLDRIAECVKETYPPRPPSLKGRGSTE